MRKKRNQLSEEQKAINRDNNERRLWWRIADLTLDCILLDKFMEVK